MANYYGSTRTNYFKVKNKKKLSKLADKLGCDLYTEKDSAYRLIELLDSGRYRITSRETIVLCSHEELDSYYDEDKDEFVDTIPELQELLCDGETCIIVHVGSEKMCYFGAYMMVITANNVEYMDLFSDEFNKIVQEKKLNNRNKQLWY